MANQFFKGLKEILVALLEVIHKIIAFFEYFRDEDNDENSYRDNSFEEFQEQNDEFQRQCYASEADDYSYTNLMNIYGDNSKKLNN